MRPPVEPPTSQDPPRRAPETERAHAVACVSRNDKHFLAELRVDNGSGASALARGRQPIFLIGQPRSGTTLLQRLINSTGNALLCGEHLGLLRGVAQSYMEFFHHPRLRSLIRHQNLGVARAARAVQKLRDPRLFSALVNGLESLNSEIVGC